MPMMSVFAFSQLIAIMGLSIASAHSSAFGSMPLCNQVGGIPWIGVAGGLIGTIVFAFHPKFVGWAMLKIQSFIRRRDEKQLLRKEFYTKWSEVDLVIRITVAEAFWIVTVEAILKDSLHSNRSANSASSWQFGQILAMFLILGPLFDLLKTVRGRWLRRRSYPSKDVMQERQKTEERLAEEGLRDVKLKLCNTWIVSTL